MNWGLGRARRRILARPTNHRLWWAGLLLSVVWATTAWSAEVRPPESEETRLFNAAAQAFNDGFHERADREFGEFARSYPQSERLGEAILYQAQARFKLGRYEVALEGLKANLAQAGSLADQYRYWMAETWFYRANYPVAASMYGQLAKEFPGSPLAPNAAFGEAYAWYKQGDLTNALTLLRRPEGTFQRIAQNQPTNGFVLRGRLLLAEVHTQLKEHAAAEQVLAALPPEPLQPELEWQRQALQVQMKLRGSQPAGALAHVTNLLALAELKDLRRLKPEAVAWHGQVLRQLGNLMAAIEVSRQNLAANVPLEYRQQALVVITELQLEAGQLDAATATLSQLIEQFPNDPAQDRWRLKLGELFLRHYRLLVSGNLAADPTNRLLSATNLLQRALEQFDQSIARHTNSPVLGETHLNRGWCLWEAGRLPESAAAFQTAMQLLPSGERRAQAQFNWADAQYRLGDLDAAATNYQQLIAHLLAPGSPPPNPQLLQPAFYQLVRVKADRGDLSAATRNMRELLKLYPTNAYADRVLLLVGQLHNRQDKPAEARGILNELVTRFPESPLVPEARLALARTYAQERNWTTALATYDGWIQAFTNHPVLSQAEYQRALAYDQAGQGAQALVLFTNFVARFSTDRLAPQAQNWIGDYYYNIGQYPKAEENYQILSQKWPGSELSYPARIKAGQAAFLRQGFDHAIGYFTNLINDTQCPEALVAEAFFILGDVLMSRPSTNLVSRYEPAIVAFSKIPQNYPTNRLSPLAWGKIGECYLQLAAQDTNQYANAALYFGRVLESPLADWNTRCQAEVGLAIISEKRAQLQADPEKARLLAVARDRYLDVLYEKKRRPEDPRSPVWLEKAGLEAARLAESQNQWDQAVVIYNRLEQLLPALRPQLERKREAALKSAAHP